MLRTNRIYGADAELAVGVKFADAFRGEIYPRAIDGSQVTRWERASQRISYSVIRRYEQLLGLPAQRLVTVADVLYREARGVAGMSYLDRGLDGSSKELRTRTDDLLDRALGCERMSGSDWDELTNYLWAIPSIYLYPARLWNDLADRLLAEMIIADGIGWLQRSESVGRLLGHPIGELAVIGSCAALVGDSDNQVFIEPLTVLEWSAHDEAAHRVVRQLTHPTNEHAYRGAWWTAAEKVGKGHFTQDQVERLSRLAVELLAADRQHPSCRLAAAELLRQTEHSGFSSKLTSAVHRVMASDRQSRQVRDSGRVASAETRSAISRRVAAVAMNELPRDAMDEDPMLLHLLDNMLFHPQLSRRFEATNLIDATPYRTSVARALTGELQKRDVLDDPAVAPAAVYAISQLGDVRTARFLAQVVLTPGAPVVVAETAIWALGHGEGVVNDEFWYKAMDLHRANTTAARGIIYALGVMRNTRLLRSCRADSSLPPPARRAASWWLNLPSAVLASTEKGGA